MRYWLVMPAAGVGKRFGAEVPKQYAPLAGRTVIEWALAPFVADPRCIGIRVVLAADDPHWAKLDLTDPADRLQTVIGGATRSASVRAGLATLDAPGHDWVLVHDAARPCVRGEDIDALLLACASAPDGALLAQPVADTLKRSAADGRVAETLDRNALWRAQTPQAFPVRVLREALAACASRGDDPTDCAQAVEWAGRRPQLVPGDASNLKVTTSADLAVATAILLEPEDVQC